MAFLENIGKKVGEAAQAAAKKSGELVEITKLSVNINSEEDKMQKLYVQIGKVICDKYNNGVANDDVKDLCEGIKVHEQNVKNLKEKIMTVKGNKICINCGTEIDKMQVFCSKCGSKNDIAQSVDTTTYQQAAPMLSCPSCGIMLQGGSAFCTNCGTKIV